MFPLTAKSDSSLALMNRNTPWHFHVWLWLGMLVVLIVVSSLGYMLIDSRFTFLEALYMTAITISGVGYREVHDLDAKGQAWTMLIIVVGRIVVTVVITVIVAMVVEVKVRRLLGRRQLERKIATLSGHVIVCGYGRVGRLVSADLIAGGRDVVAVDLDAERTAAAGAAGLLYVLGDSQDEAVLRAAGVERAETLVAALGTDADNVFLALSARQANPSLRIIAEARESASQDKLIKAGATRVVCPQTIAATRIASVVLRPAVVDFVEMARRGVELELDQLELSAESSLVGKTLRELSLPARIGVQVVAVQRADGEAIYHPTSTLELAAGDTLILVGKSGAAEAVQQLQVESDQA